MFILSLFITAKHWRNNPNVHQLENIKLWYIHTMEHY